MKSQNEKHIPIAFWVPSVYFTMGLPFVALTAGATLMYKTFGISDGTIAFWTSLIMLPWSLKPLWSPLLEIYRTKKFFVVATQLLSGLLFGLVAFTLPLDNFFRYSIALLAVIAFSGATHDIATDGVYLNVLNAKDQARYVGWQGAFYNISKLVSSGGLVYLAGELEQDFGIVHAWMVVMGLYAGIMITMAIYHIKYLPSGGNLIAIVSVQDGLKTIKDVIVTFFEKKYIWFGIGFIILYRFAEGQAIKIAPLFFKAARHDGGLGLTTSQIGIVYGTVGSLAYVLGTFVAGHFVSTRGLTKKSLLFLCAAFNLPFIVYTYLAFTQPENIYLISLLIAVEYFGYGFGFVGLVVFIIQQITPGKYKMSHYAFASGIMNLGFVIPSMVSGYLSDYLGYANFYLWILAATIPSFLVTWLVPLKPHDENA